MGEGMNKGVGCSVAFVGERMEAGYGVCGRLKTLFLGRQMKTSLDKGKSPSLKMVAGRHVPCL